MPSDKIETHRWHGDEAAGIEVEIAQRRQPRQLWGKAGCLLGLDFLLVAVAQIQVALHVQRGQSSELSQAGRQRAERAEVQIQHLHTPEMSF